MSEDTSNEKKEEPRFVGAKTIAQYFGVSVRRVQQLTQDGVIDTVMDGKFRRYNLDDTLMAYIRYLTVKANKKAASVVSTDIQEQKLQAEVKLKRSQAELHDMKREIAAGKYISKEEVILDYQRFFTVFKRFAMSIPPRLIGMISDTISPADARRAESELTEEVKRVLNAFAVAGVASKPEKTNGKTTKADHPKI